jgi:hypothetical protein
LDSEFEDVTMAFDFPANPSIGSTYNFAGITYVWDGLAWNVQTGPSVKTAQARNRIFNPAMQHSQETGGAASAASPGPAAYFMADQWAGVFRLTSGSVQAMLTAMPAAYSSASPFVASLSVPTGKATFATDDYLLIRQSLEGGQIADFRWGTANALPVVLRFIAAASTPGLYSVRIANADSTRSFVAQFNADPTAKLVSIPIPGDTTGTWPKGTGIGAMIDFCQGVGSTYVGVTGWQAGNKYAGPGQLTGVANGAVLNIGDVGLHLDPDNTGVPPPFETPDYADELDRCKRYWHQFYMLFSGNVTSGANYYASARINPTMRTTPIFSGAASGGIASFPNTPGALAGAADWVYEPRLANASGTGVFQTTVTMNARM